MELPFLTAFLLHKEKEDELLSSYMKCVNSFINEDNTKHFSTIAGIPFPIKKDLNPPKNYKPKQILDSFYFVKSLDEETKSRTEIKKKLLILEKQKDIFSKMIESYLYLKENNYAKASKVWKDIIYSEVFRYGFETNISQKYHKIITEYTIDVLIKISSTVGEDRLFQILLIYLYHNTNGEFKEKIEDNFDVELSESQLLKLSNSSNFGKDFPNIWFPLLSNEKGLTQAQAYLRKSNFYTQLEQKDLSSIYLLENYFTTTKKEREIIFKAFSILESKQDSYLKDLRLRLLSNNKIKDYLIRKNHKYNVAMFSQKRNHYRNLLTQSTAIEYALFELIKLGDFSPEYLFYLQSE